MCVVILGGGRTHTLCETCPALNLPRHTHSHSAPDLHEIKLQIARGVRECVHLPTVDIHRNPALSINAKEAGDSIALDRKGVGNGLVLRGVNFLLHWTMIKSSFSVCVKGNAL
jgi:hypothetical protein